MPSCCTRATHDSSLMLCRTVVSHGPAAVLLSRVVVSHELAQVPAPSLAARGVTCACTATVSPMHASRSGAPTVLSFLRAAATMRTCAPLLAAAVRPNARLQAAVTSRRAPQRLSCCCQALAPPTRRLARRRLPSCCCDLLSHAPCNPLNPLAPPCRPHVHPRRSHAPQRCFPSRCRHARSRHRHMPQQHRFAARRRCHMLPHTPATRAHDTLGLLRAAALALPPHAPSRPRPAATHSLVPLPLTPTQRSGAQQRHREAHCPVPPLRTLAPPPRIPSCPGHTRPRRRPVGPRHHFVPHKPALPSRAPLPASLKGRSTVNR
ncbi:hypothetical protein DENSPDRAFT_886222 [Dentipellis sp. KUC8613]|nr:hypothetical protein DENSPDRAFT_886222 [Dentipellis sp. KUC8613]